MLRKAAGDRISLCVSVSACWVAVARPSAEDWRSVVVHNHHTPTLRGRRLPGRQPLHSVIRATRSRGIWLGRRPIRCRTCPSATSGAWFRPAARRRSH